MGSAHDMADRYRKLSPLEHVLARPDTYIGSVQMETDDAGAYVLSEDRTGMVFKPLSYNPGLFKIFDEIITNAIDQSVLDPTLDAIRVDVDVDAGRISVFNSGAGIPIERHAEYDDVYIPELIFGHLLTSSNYDDDQERVVGGKNGLGAKLTNIYSTEFVVDIVDAACSGLAYSQTFENNMTIARPPKIAKSRLKKGSVRISFRPDLSRFGMTRLDEGDTLEVLRRRTWDASACTPARVKVSFNGEVVPIKTFEKYVDMFVGGTRAEAPRVFVATDDGRWEVAVAPSPTGSFRQVSFVNGIATTKGGTHVNHAVAAIIDGLKTKKYADVKTSFVRDHMFVFVRATLVNPSFSSQSKQECTSKVASFGSRFAPPNDDFFKKVAKLGIMEEALALAKHRETRKMSKTDGAKTSTIRGIPKLEDATRAGTKDSARCTLLVVEGDSAKTFAISGLSVLGREFWGVFPLRGKLLNVRDASPKQIMENQEIQHLKQIIGLQQGRQYEDVSALRYGRVMLLTDADLDGSHIKGLVINMFAHFWPSLVRLPFLSCMTTPIVKARRGQQVLAFYTQREYNEWKDRDGSGSGWTVRYYKGLGTSTAAEAREYFGDMTALTTEYRHRDDENDEAAIILAFKRDRARDRKAWILEHSGSGGSNENHRSGHVSISGFVHGELVHFSIADVVRSIPSVCDGLKPSQRKVLYGALKKDSEIKVSQLSGYIAEITAYHHGDASLQGTIVGMAQNFVGSNNINLLEPVGQFGTRLQGGKDAASARYIFTKLGSLTRALFDARDDALLTPLDDDGYAIEPAYYVPTLPMVLVNGAEGIGTGFSTSIPCYNPADLAANVERFLAGRAMTPMTPWYRGFTGTVDPVGDSTSFVTRGRFEKRGSNRDLWITELPVGMWTQTYKEWLEAKFDAKFENHSTETDVLFKLTFPDAAARDKVCDHKTLNLCTTLHTGNMYLLDADGRVQHYNTPLEILEDYCRVRLEYYARRRRHLIEVSRADLDVLDEKIRFVRAVVDVPNELVVFGRPLAEVRADMTRLGFRRIDALLDIRIASLTLEKVLELERQAASKRRDIDRLDAATPGDMWLTDLTFAKK